MKYCKNTKFDVFSIFVGEFLSGRASNFSGSTFKIDKKQD